MVDQEWPVGMGTGVKPIVSQKSCPFNLLGLQANCPLWFWPKIGESSGPKSPMIKLGISKVKFPFLTGKGNWEPVGNFRSKEEFGEGNLPKIGELGIQPWNLGLKFPGAKG